MKRVIIEVWNKGKRRKTYLEYFYLVSMTRETMNIEAMANVKRQYGRFHPVDSVFKVKGSV